MNEVIKAILERQTIRSYKKEQITDEQLDLLMQAAKKAPSGRNMHGSFTAYVHHSSGQKALQSAY